MKSSGSTKSHNSRWLWIVASILLLAYFLRLFGLTSESLWIDEGYSLALADRNLRDIIRGTAADQHPPLYYILLHLWLSAGQSVFHLRYLSVLIGVLGIAVSALVGRQVLGQDAGMAAALLLACSPMHIWYSQEARMYILLTLLTTLSAYGLWRLLRGKGGWVLCGLSMLLALYTHYFAGFVLFFENLLVLSWGLKRRQRRVLVRWIWAQIIVCALFVPWLPVVLCQIRSHQMSWIGPPTTEMVRDTLIEMTLGAFWVRRGGILPLVGSGVVALAIIWTTQRSHKRERLGNYGFLLLWFVLPFGAVTAVSKVYPIFQTKQFLLLSTPLLLLVCGAVTALPKGLRLVFAGMLVFFFANSLSVMYGLKTKDDWREVAAYVEGNYQTGDVLYLNPAAGMLTLRVYLDQTIPSDGYPPGYDIIAGGWEGERITRKIAEQAMSILAAKYQRLWLVEFVPGFWDPGAHLATWLDHHDRLIADRPFGRVRVRLYSLAKDSGL